MKQTVENHKEMNSLTSELKKQGIYDDGMGKSTKAFTNKNSTQMNWMNAGPSR